MNGICKLEIIDNIFLSLIFPEMDKPKIIALRREWYNCQAYWQRAG